MKHQFKGTLAIIGFIASASTGTHADINTRCIDVKVSDRVNYSRCNIQTPNPDTINLEAEREALMLLDMIKKQFDQQVKQNWYPPMGFSGYSVRITYMLHPSNGKPYAIRYEDYFNSDELKDSMAAALERVGGLYIPDQKALQKRLLNTRLLSTFYVR